MSSRFPRPANRNQGFSLVELMVAMALSLIVIRAVIGVFAANQQTSRAQADLNNAQEAFRFASHTIKRVVRQGQAIRSPAGGEWLQVLISPSGEDGYKDCLGRPIAVDTLNTFTIVDGNLRCNVDTDNTTEILVTGLDQPDPDPDRDTTKVLFGEANDEYWADNDQWKAPGAVTDWDDVRSVNVTLAMLDRAGQSHGRVGRFSATMRMHVLNEASGIGGAGGLPGGGGGGGNDGGTSTGPGDDGSANDDSDQDADSGNGNGNGNGKGKKKDKEKG